MKVRQLTSIEQMLSQLHIMQELYPRLTEEKYRTMLQDMIPNNYTQIAVFDNEECVGISGLWFNTKLWSGKYLELDNFVVSAAHRSKGIGKMICDFAEVKAHELGCTNIVLDAYTTNFGAHRFYYNQGYGAKGFHFVKILDPDGLT